MKKILILSLLTSAVLLAAQTPINTGDILRQVEPVKLPQTPVKLPSIGDTQYNVPIAAQDDAKIFIKSFKLTGNQAVTTETLLALIKPYESKELGLNGLKEIASIITKYYRDNGYFVARAYLPAQSIEDETVQIAIVEGNYGAFELKNTSLVNTKEVQAFMDNLKEGEKVSTKSLERQMLLINDLNGAQVTNAEVLPGKEVGTSDFIITVDATPKYTGYAIVDNYGNRYTGENRLSLGADVNSLSGIGDVLSINGLISHNTDIKNGRIAYERPFGYTGLKGGVSFSVTDYMLEEIPSYDAFGVANIYNMYISYPFLKTSTHTQLIQLDYDHKDIKDSGGLTGLVTESKKQLDSLTLKGIDIQTTSFFNLPGNLYSSLEFTLGRLGLKNDNARLADATGFDAEGTYTKLAFNATHNQYLVQNTSLQTTFKAQKSFNKNLDSAEDISVGGSNGVRAYEDSELNGDQGYLVSLDLIYNLPSIAQVSHNTSLFVDHARIWNNTKNFNAEENIRNLNAVGIGYSLNYKKFDLKSTLGHGFGSDSTPRSEAEFSTSKTKFLIQGIMRF
ncbi:MAG: ShlB/FhaC/HecB family hemolysin secretion/activation protein [Fusobacteriaceae bacterium]|nr:ShlB/FhaC/HecB family hemolysin secretion/activation protein [Fusobacteriaceae bacterium]